MPRAHNFDHLLAHFEGNMKKGFNVYLPLKFMLIARRCFDLAPNMLILTLMC